MSKKCDAMKQIRLSDKNHRALVKIKKEARFTISLTTLANAMLEETLENAAPASILRKFVAG